MIHNAFCVMNIISILLMLLTIGAGLSASGISLSAFFDIASIAFIAIPCFACSITIATFSESIKAYLYILWPSSKLNVDKETLLKIYSINSFVALGSGIIFTLIGIFAMLPLLDLELATLGRGLAASILPLIYGLIAKYLFFAPAISKLKKEGS